MNRFALVATVLLLAGPAAAQNQNHTRLVPSFKTGTPTGSLQPMNISQSMTLDTDALPYPIEVLSFTVQPGAVVKVVGSNPLFIKAELDIFIFGTLDTSGESGNLAGTGGPSGFGGGDYKQPGAGASAGQPGLGLGGGGGAGNLSAGQPGSGPGAGAGGNAAPPIGFQTFLTHASGGGGANVFMISGGGGGGIARLHAKSRIFINGVLRANGGAGGDCPAGDTGGGCGGGAGGSIELVAPMVQVSGPVTALGGSGGMGSNSGNSGGDGGFGPIVVRANTFSGINNFTPVPLELDYGAVMTPQLPSACISIQPDFSDFPAFFGAEAYLFMSGARFQPGQGVALGGGKELLLDPTDALFDPAGLLYSLLLGQGGSISPLTLETSVLADFSPIAAALDVLGLEYFSIFVQAFLVQNGALVDASNVTTLDYLSD